MSSTQFTYKKSSMANLKSTQVSNERKIYENLLLALLARNAYKLSKANSKFRNFSVGRDVDLGKEGEFGDVVLSYMDQDDTKNLIFLKLEYRMHDFQIDSKVLSAEATKAKVRKRRSFNLQKYFFSYLSVREKLKGTNDEELKNGKIKYVAIVTNVELNTEELSSSGIRFKEAPYDIINLFSLRKSSATTEKFHKCYQHSDINESLRKIPKKSSDSGSVKRELSRYVVGEKHEENKIMGIDDTSTDSNMCYQLNYVSEDLCKSFKRNSHLHRLARELVQYVVLKNYGEKEIMGIDKTPIKYYHVALEREVIQKSCDIKLFEKPLKNEQYYEAQFRDDFLENDKPGPKQTLRDAIFEAIKEMDKSMKDASDDELKCILRQVKWKLAVNFGKTKQGTKNNLPREWMTVKEEDITDFLKCFVFVVNQPRRTDLEARFHATRMCDVAFMRILRKTEDAGLNWRERVDEVLEISKARKWVTGEEITNAIEEQEQSLKREIYEYVKFSKLENPNLIDLATEVTLIYEHEMHQYGKFSNLENLTETLNIFLLGGNQILCINTSEILLSSIKILQILDAGLDNEAEGCRISVDLDILKCKLIREYIIKSFLLENNNLITIECRHSVDDQDVVEFYYKLSKVVRDNPKKKVILIVQQEGHNILLEKFKKDFQNKEELIVINDSIDLKDFVPVEDPLQKKIIAFQGQKQRVSLAELTGIDSWKFYSQERFHEIIDGTTLIKILSNDEIEIGSKPLGTCNLSGAYAFLFEEVNTETLANKLLSKESDDNIHEMYIMSGISGSSKQEKIEKLIECLGLTNMKEIIENQLGDIDSDSRIKIADDIFKDEDFKAICHKHPEKEIFWIYIKDEQKFILQKFYNPNFYLKRKFKNVIIKNEVKELLMDDNLAETFIFSPVNDLEKFYISLGLTDEKGKRRVEDNNECSIYFSEDDDAMAAFKDLCRKNKTVHWLKFEEEQFVWCDSYGSVNNLRKFIDHGKSEISLVEEDNLIKEIKNKKLVIIADDPGTGKTTTITKLYESKHQSTSFIETHWIVKINIMENLQAIRDIKFSDSCIDIASVVNFLSKVDVKLNNNLAKNLLEIALDKKENFLKPILIVIDGFDEVLDEVHRNKVVSLLKFLKNETAAKLWITTRTHFKYFLEDELSTFAIQFNPMGTDTQFTYIKMYLEDRLRLILNEKKFDEFFTDSGKMPTVIQKFLEAFLNKMISVFKSKVFNFIGTPLQLHLMLEGSITHFKCWIESNNDEYPNFSYLGNDAWEVHENFIYRKYDVFFQKVDMKDYEQRRREKFLLNMYCKELAISLIFKLEPKNSLKAFQDSALSTGIITSDGTEIEFTHPSFRDYFASEVFIDWMMEKPNELSSTKKHEYILKEILKRPDFQLVRTFINIKLEKIVESGLIEGITQHYGEIIAKLLMEEQSALIGEEVLHIAIEERNLYIARFLLHSLKGYPHILEQFLFTHGKRGTTTNKEEYISREHKKEYILKEVLKRPDFKVIRTSINLKLMISAKSDLPKEITQHYGEIIEKLVTEEQSALIGEEGTVLHIAIKERNLYIACFLINSLERHPDVLRQFLFTRGKHGVTALHLACRGFDYEIVCGLLDAAGRISEATLQEFLNALTNYKWNALDEAVCKSENVQIVNELLKRAYNKLDLIVNEKKRKSSLILACKFGKEETVRALVQEFKHEPGSLKYLLSFNGGCGNVMYCAAMKSRAMFNYFLNIAKSLNDNNETLKKLFFPSEGYLLFKRTNQIGNIMAIMTILNATKDIYDDNFTLEMLLLNCVSLKSDLLIAEQEHLCIMKAILETAASFGNEKFEKFIFDLITKDKTFLYVIVENSDFLKILEEDKYRCVRKKIIEMFDSIPLKERLSINKKRLIEAIRRNKISKVKDILDRAKNSKNSPKEKLRTLLLAIDNEKFKSNTLHMACQFGRTGIIKELISYAIEINDEGETLKELITSCDSKNETPFQVLNRKHANKVKRIIKSLILEATKDNNERVSNVLEEIIC